MVSGVIAVPDMYPDVDPNSDADAGVDADMNMDADAERSLCQMLS